MPRNDNPALQLLELQLRIQTLQAALAGNASLTPDERRELDRAIAQLQTEAQALEEALRNAPPGRP